MDDCKIIEMYETRDEQAITHTAKKYGRYCYSIAYGILRNREDADESVNDTYLGAWNTIPPAKPSVLRTFLGRITRNLSLKKQRYNTAEKRGGGETELALSELAECVASDSSVEKEVETTELAAVIDVFLRELPFEECQIFLCRYWYFESIKEISARFGYGQSKVKMTLLRTREKLKERLIREEMY